MATTFVLSDSGFSCRGFSDEVLERSHHPRKISVADASVRVAGVVSRERMLQSDLAWADAIHLDLVVVPED